MQSVSACPMNGTGGHTQPDKPGRMIVATRPDKFRRIGNNHTSFVVVCPFHASGDVFFLLGFLFFHGFSLKFFPVHNLPLLSFTSILRLSVSRIRSVIFVLGAKVIPGLDGKARSSLLFSEKSPALRVVFSRKTLHSLIPTFSSTRNENDRCDRKTHKKNVG